MPDINGWLSEYEFEYLSLYKDYHADRLTEGQLVELSEIAKLLYPQVYKKIFEKVGLDNNEVMIKAAYNIAMTGGKRAGYLLLVDRGMRIEYAKYEYLNHIECIPFYKRERRYRDIEAYSLDGVLKDGYHYNQGLEVRRLSGKDKHYYRVYGDSQSVEK